MCMGHKRRRWTCCDNTSRGTDGNNGCEFRFHMAEQDPFYANLLCSIEEQNQSTLVQVQEELEETKEHNWPLQAFRAKRGQVIKMEDNLQDQRDEAATFHHIKWH